MPATPMGWSLRFGDDFSGPQGGSPSSARWQMDTGQSYPGGPPHWGTQELETYTVDASNVSLDGNGHLLITPRRDSQGHWTSGRIETRQADFKAPAGGVLRIEARIQMPDVMGVAALGYWPAFWALGAPYRHKMDWPGMGEFDIMESINGSNGVWGTLHCGVYPGGPCHEPRGIAAKMTCTGDGCQTAFHIYTFEWDRSVVPEQLRWYVDGRVLNYVGQNQLPAATWHAMTDHAGFFLLLNVAIGGGFGDTLSSLVTPSQVTESGHAMVVDYVGVWTRSSGSTTSFPLDRVP